MRILLMLSLTLLCLSSAAHAVRTDGEFGSSGGGEFQRDQHNPWFVKNTAQVEYCVEIDPEGFSAPAEKIQPMIDRALQYWVKEFADRGALLGIAAQKFVRTGPPSGGCQGSEDLKLQFGYGALSAEQKNRFTIAGEQPQDYVGIAVRTDYDRKTLKGKGFVLIASDRGASPYNFGAGLSRNLWSHEGLLFRILQHELGHVFGIAHTESGFMAADFPEAMVRNYGSYRTIKETPFFAAPAFYLACASDRPLPYPDLSCMEITTSTNWQSFTATGIKNGGERFIIGQGESGKRTSVQQQYPVRVFLPKEQAVFETTPGELFWKGPARTSVKSVLTFTETGKDKSSMLLELSPDSLEIYQTKPTGIERWL
ncbi:MAG: hypothetical protein EOP11_04075 [Proteobacteria bacterium]|nr:MAG: hypothetical protein EOP11_04075 [Pseudomonadota bacterium]